jgi:hypothetical protein
LTNYGTLRGPSGRSLRRSSGKPDGPPLHHDAGDEPLDHTAELSVDR